MQASMTSVWLVFVMGAARKAGLLPIHKDLFHRIIFLSNCLAPLFQETPAVATVVKYKRGPFYPAIQWYLDRLAVQGVLEVSDVSYTQDSYGSWMDAKYFTNGRTQSIIETCTQIQYGRRLEEYLTEMVFAVASIDGRTWNSAALYDANYDEPGKSEGAFINFTELNDNLSVQTAQEFQTVLPNSMIISPREEMFLYLRFLEARAAKEIA